MRILIALCGFLQKYSQCGMWKNYNIIHWKRLNYVCTCTIHDPMHVNVKIRLG